jgi:dihydropteroate synthase
VRVVSLLKESIVDIGGLSVGPSCPVRTMGVVNLSPESFYGGSVAKDEKDLVERVKAMIEQGADLVDVGGASSSPKNIYEREETSLEEELARVSSAFRALRGINAVPMSVDTTSSAVAETALKLGASLVNDISGLTADPQMVELIAQNDVPVVLMANCGVDCTSIDISLKSLRRSLGIAADAGIPENRIIVDPGMGFGKPPEVDFAILRGLRLFTYFRRPLLVGLSRKAFIGSCLNQQEAASRLLGSVSATSLAVYNGADMIRTHDVSETLIAIRIGEATRGTPVDRSED